MFLGGKYWKHEGGGLFLRETLTVTLFILNRYVPGEWFLFRYCFQNLIYTNYVLLFLYVLTIALELLRFFMWYLDLIVSGGGLLFLLHDIYV